MNCIVECTTVHWEGRDEFTWDENGLGHLMVDDSDPMERNSKLWNSIECKLRKYKSGTFPGYGLVIAIYNWSRSNHDNDAVDVCFGQYDDYLIGRSEQSPCRQASDRSLPSCFPFPPCLLMVRLDAFFRPALCASPLRPLIAGPRLAVPLLGFHLTPWRVIEPAKGPWTRFRVGQPYGTYQSASDSITQMLQVLLACPRQPVEGVPPLSSRAGSWQ